MKDGKVLKTGFYLNELMQPVKALLDAGHEITFATPKGTAPSVDVTSIDKMYFGGDEAAMKASEVQLAELQLTSSDTSPVVSLARVEQIGYDHFDAVYVPGGHAPMQDLLMSSELGKLLTDFHENGKPTALACHGPVKDHTDFSAFSAVARYLASRRSKTSLAALVRPASASAIPRMIEASSAASLVSRSWTNRTPSRRTSLFEP
ncbi:ThiJ/PfpI domain-containing protein [Rhizobium grahamii CCGE 502]|uniref:ThiJ/PfpI domain-containing protein n=1 Tax=Rhizobium grahamii CCGE 502 TaxID=990285 RepID=S3IAN4_9HYPH|nr:ThiJ/PfpI domain-containing protein [Rhizobium grahamii CCGE 502]